MVCVFLILQRLKIQIQSSLGATILRFPMRVEVASSTAFLFDLLIRVLAIGQQALDPLLNFGLRALPLRVMNRGIEDAYFVKQICDAPFTWQLGRRYIHTLNLRGLLPNLNTRKPIAIKPLVDFIQIAICGFNL